MIPASYLKLSQGVQDSSHPPARSAPEAAVRNTFKSVGTPYTLPTALGEEIIESGKGFSRKSPRYPLPAVGSLYTRPMGFRRFEQKAQFAAAKRPVALIVRYG